MSTKIKSEAKGLDGVKLLAGGLLFAIGIVGFYYFEGHSLLLRVLGLLAVFGLAAFIALQTTSGQVLWRFAADANLEVRKVVWPTRQETVQTTLIVLAMVFVLAILLWLFDSLLMMIMRALTGQGG